MDWLMYSKHLTVWFAAVALLSSVAVSKQTPHKTTAASDEPFRSFRIVDAKLTLLTKQQDALKVASGLAQSKELPAAQFVAKRQMLALILQMMGCSDARELREGPSPRGGASRVAAHPRHDQRHTFWKVTPVHFECCELSS
jgi:hypothetical protein